MQLNELKNDQDEAIASKDFVRAQQLNLEMDQLKVGLVIHQTDNCLCCNA